MKNITSYKNKIKELDKLINSLIDGQMTIEDLSTLERLTRELHERSIILKYKAFEKMVIGENDEIIEQSLVPDVVDSDKQTNEDVQEAISSEDDSSKVDQPVIDFSFFDEKEEEQVIEENKIESFHEPISELKDDFSEINATNESADRIEELPIEKQDDRPGQILQSTFLEKLAMPVDSPGSQFLGSKLQSLIGAFGLNEKLRFINDLFDGSSETFSEVIKSLDTQNNLNEANQKVVKIAEQFQWDPEDEVVVEFMTYLNRRYA